MKLAYAMKSMVCVVVSALLTMSCATAPREEEGVIPPSLTNKDAGVVEDLIYRIQPGDKLFISVYNEDELQKDIIVRPDGGITFPLIGDIEAKGKSVPELRDEITQRLTQYIPEATVSVSLKEVVGNKIFVLGQVKNPGQYVLTGDVDVLQALSMAGGLTAFANGNKIKIIRRNKESNSREVIPFSYRKVMRGEGLDQNIILRSGDTVIVP